MTEDRSKTLDLLHTDHTVVTNAQDDELKYAYPHVRVEDALRMKKELDRTALVQLASS
jgi:hypothetical protein